MQKSNLTKYSILLTALIVSACGGGGGGGISGGTGGGGSNNSLNIQSIATVSNSLNAGYNATCLYGYGNYTYLVKGDGSGTGYSLNLSNGQVSPATGLPTINLSNGDKCLSNYQLLTWYNASTPYLINIFDPVSKITTSADLSNTGIAWVGIDNSSFAISGDRTSIYSNNNFLNNGSFAFNQFILPNPVTYTQLNNSLYATRNASQVLYGFNGTAGQWQQLFPADAGQGLAAAIAYVQLAPNGQAPVQKLSTITNSANQGISEMTGAWDFTSAGNGVIVTTGAVQPVLFKCPLSSASSYTCTKSYTEPELASRYKIMRLLGGNSNSVYFLGTDLTKADIEIFSLPL